MPYLKMFERSCDGILLVHAASGEVLEANPSVTKFLGCERDELVGRCIREMEAFRPLSACIDIEESAEDEVQRREDLLVRARDGSIRLAEVSVGVYREMGRRLVQLHLRDVTERRKIERELAESRRLETLGMLAGGMAHDLNNILTRITGYATLGYTKTDPEEPVRQNLREIELATEQAAHLIRQMLAYAGRGQYAICRVDIGAMIREISPEIGEAVPSGVGVELRLADGLPEVEADSAELQQVLMELVRNGAEALGEGGTGEVTVETCLRHLPVEEAGDGFSAERLAPGPYVELRVTDTGSGMDAVTQSRVFDPFFTTKFTGRGLGLAAALGIVKGHGGTIRVVSAPGEGSSFAVLLPAVSRDEPSQGAAPIAETSESNVDEGLAEEVELLRHKTEATRYQFLRGELDICALALDFAWRESGDGDLTLVQRALQSVLSGVAMVERFLPRVNQEDQPELQTRLASLRSGLQSLQESPR